MLPYRFTSNELLSDAAACAKALGLRYDIVPIAEPVEGVEHALAKMFAGRARDITEENIQSRARGLILMAISNKTGAMVVTTGNKSEMSVGYATLYGDMNGGFNPIKDLYKMEVFRLSALRNRWKPVGALGPDGEVIPENIIIKPPTAELRENQKDEDSLPPYPVLDAHPARARRKGDARRRPHRRRLRSRHGAQGRAAALSRRIQAPPVGAGRQGRAEEFRPRPALSDRQPLPRSGPAGAEARRVDRAGEAGGNERTVRGVGERRRPDLPLVAGSADRPECRLLFIVRRYRTHSGLSGLLRRSDCGRRMGDGDPRRRGACSSEHSVAELDKWEAAHFREHKLHKEADYRKRLYEDALRREFYGF